MVKLLEEKPHQLELLSEITTKKAPVRVLFKGQEYELHHIEPPRDGGVQ